MVNMNVTSACSLDSLCSDQFAKKRAGNIDVSSVLNQGNPSRNPVSNQGFGNGQSIVQDQGFKGGYQSTQVNQTAPMQTAPMQTAPMQGQGARYAPTGTGVAAKKGQKISISKITPGVSGLDICVGYGLQPAGMNYDLDIEAFLLDQTGKVPGDDWFVFYNAPVSPCGSVTLKGRVNNEIMMSVDTTKVPASVKKIAFILSINEAKRMGYNFSNVKDTYIRIIDSSSQKEIIRFDLTDYYNTVTSMVLGEIYLHNGEWKFNAVGNGVSADLEELCGLYGVNVE